MPISDLCDYSDAYIVANGDITVLRRNSDAYDKKLTFKNNAPCISCISKINNILIDNAEDLGIVMPRYNLIEYSKNYRKTTGSLWNYYRDEPNNGLGSGDNNINYFIKNSKSFDYKTSITGKLEDNSRKKENAGIIVPLKYLNFWRTLGMLLITCEVSLTLTSMIQQEQHLIKDTEMYVPLVTLTAENDNKLLE